MPADTAELCKMPSPTSIKHATKSSTLKTSLLSSFCEGAINLLVEGEKGFKRVVLGLGITMMTWGHIEL